MYQDDIVLCVSNSYEKKYYLNEDFSTLPDAIKDELKIMCVLFTEEIGGILSLYYEEDGTMMMNVTAEEEDFMFDEIGSVLKVKELQRDKTQLLESLTLFYKAFFLDEEISTFLNVGEK